MQVEACALELQRSTVLQRVSDRSKRAAAGLCEGQGAVDQHGQAGEDSS